MDPLESANDRQSDVRIPRVALKDLVNQFEKYSDQEFICRFRFSKEATMNLFDIIKHDRSLMVRGNSVPPLIQLTITMRFYATGHFQRSDGDLMGVDRTTAGRIVHRISRCIASRKSQFIRLPEQHQLPRVKEEFFGIKGFPAVVGAIDCTHIPITSPGGANAEVFRNRKGFFSLNVQAVCDSNRLFTNIVIRWPGSVHDSRIFENSTLRDLFEDRKIDGMLLGDNGYPCRRYLMTPILNPSTEPEKKYNFSHIATRSRIEQSFGVLKQRFRVLRTPLRTKLENTMPIVVAVFCAHNFAIRTNQPLDDEASFVEEVTSNNATSSASSDGRSVRSQLISTHFQ